MSRICLQLRRFNFPDRSITLLFSVSTSASSTGSTLPPLTTATALRYSGNSSAWKSSAAVATAPLGSGTSRVAATMARMAARISASVTVTMPSTKAWMCAKLRTPTLCVRSPSAMVRLVSSAGQVTILPVRKLSAVSPASSGSTPKTLACGRSCFTAAAMPLSRPPPETGETTRSTSGSSSTISRPQVAWPAMICSSS